MKISNLFYIAMIIWLAVISFLWYDLEKQKMIAQDFTVDKYELGPLGTSGGNAYVYRINKSSGETHYFSPNSDLGGWVKIRETNLVTVSREYLAKKKDTIEKINKLIEEKLAGGGQDSMGTYIIADNLEKVYLEKLDLPKLNKILADIEGKVAKE